MSQIKLVVSSSQAAASHYADRAMAAKSETEQLRDETLSARDEVLAGGGSGGTAVGGNNNEYQFSGVTS